ncbi:uncharacterized protein VNE69_01334 [Vairimorpha necatrix]|uniref:Uncharacterized protein n=1 Tax=Vairimorpha necatrix TaxID=6039 RepID=A0AAX4J8U8_9MICR
MGLYLIFEVCLCALAKNSKFYGNAVNENTEENVSTSTITQKIDLEHTVEIYYCHKSNHRQEMLFSKLVNDCFIKDSAPDSYSYSGRHEYDGFEYKIKLTKVREKKPCFKETKVYWEKGNEFAFIDEEIEYNIKKDFLNKTMLNGKSVAIQIGNSSNFNYLVIPIFIRPYTIKNESGMVKIKPFMSGFIDLFGDLFEENFIKLNKDDKDIVLKFINNICHTSQRIFNADFENKTFLLANDNLDKYKELFKILKENIDKDDLVPTTLVNILTKKLRYSMSDFKLSKYYTKNLLTKKILQNFDTEIHNTFNQAVKYGILTDIVNLLRLCRNPDYKFNFYENLTRSSPEITLYACVRVKIECKYVDQIEKENIEIMCICETPFSGFDFCKLDDGIQLSLKLKDAQKCLCYISKINILIQKNDMVYQTDWIPVEMEDEIYRDLRVKY